MAVEICMIIGDHAWPQFNGHIVEAEYAGECENDEGTGSFSLFRTNPVYYCERGREIYWQRTHLARFADFPKEELENESEPDHHLPELR